MTNKKPSLAVSLSGTEGNAFAIIAKTRGILEGAGQVGAAQKLTEDFTKLTRKPGSTYEQVKRLAEKYCTVTWLP